MNYIGVDIGGTSVKAGIVSPEGEILCSGATKTNVDCGSLSVIGDIANLIGELLKKQNAGVTEIGGIGVGCPGAVDGENGVVLFSGNLHWENVALRDEMANYFETLPIFVSNDANMAALGEATYGAGKEYGDSVLITVGTGIGGGIVIGDQLFEGNRAAGAEIGHMVIRVDGEPCTCGRNGCFEAYASATALIRQTRRTMQSHPESTMWKTCKTLDDVDGKTAFEYAKKGDAAAKAVVEEYIRYLGEGIVNIANVLRPEVIILGGGVSAQGENLIKPLQKYLDGHVFGKTKTARVLVIKAKLGNDAGIIGAAELAKQRTGKQNYHQ